MQNVFTKDTFFANKLKVVYICTGYFFRQRHVHACCCQTKSSLTRLIGIYKQFFCCAFCSNGFKLYLSACHSHFIAFDTNKQIDELMEADVSYESQNVIHRLGIGGGYEWM